MKYHIAVHKSPHVDHIKSEKKKSVFEGGGPAISELGMSTISPDKSLI
jgi:hypothetical protein